MKKWLINEQCCIALRNYCSFIFFIVLNISGMAQLTVNSHSIDTTALYTELIDQESGLSQGLVSSIVEDKEGYLWLATKDGLNRYDGKKFKVYRPDPLDSNAISDGFITTLFLDSKDRLWVGTYSGGLNLFDRELERFIHFKYESDNPLSISSNNVIRISELNKNQLLIETANGAFFEIMTGLDTESHTLASTIKFDPITKLYPETNPLIDSLHSIRNHVVDVFGSVWIYLEYQVYRIQFNNNEECRIDRYRIRDPEQFAFMDAYYLPIHIINFSSDSSIYIAKDRRQVLKFDLNENTFLPYLKLPEPFQLKGKPFIDRDQYLNSIQDDANLLKISLSDSSILLKTTTNNKAKTLFSNFDYLNVHLDKNNSIWFGSIGSGVVKAIDFSDRFMEIKKGKTSYKNFRFHSEENQALFDIKLQEKWNALPLDQILEKDQLLFRNYDFVAHSAIDSDSSFWMSFRDKTGEKGFLYGFKKNNTDYVKVPMKSANNNLDFVPNYIFVGKDKNIWFTSRAYNQPGPLNLLDQKTLEIKEYDFPTQIKESSYPFVSEWVQDSDSVFWFATVDGIYSFHPTSKSWQKFQHQAKNPKSLAAQRTFSILLDPIKPDSFLWVGTDGGGLNKMNKITGEFTLYTTKNGLPNNVIYGILPDKQNNLWLSTNRGLCLFNPQTLETRNFGKEDGLPVLEFNRYAYSKDNESNLYFEGEGKIVKVNTTNFYKKRTSSKVTINELKLFNKPVYYGASPQEKPLVDFELAKPISLSEELMLPYSAKMITLGFTLLDLTAPKNNRYKYKLEGFDNEWLEASDKQEATYTNLNPGTYTFKVKGYNSQDVWSEPTLLTVNIIPPIWQKWWFRTLFILLFMGIFYLIYRNRVRQLLKVERMRNDIAQDLHDEIGSTLSSISLYSAVMQNTSAHLPPKTIQLLDKIIESTSSVMANMNDMVWTIKADNDNFQKIVNRLRAFAVNLTESKNIDLQFTVDKHSEELNLSMNQRKNIYLIFKEAINNALKYSEATILEINIKTNGAYLEIVTKDNGKGFDYQEESTEANLLGGNGISGMIFRAKQIKADLRINSTIGSGTNIRFQLKL